MRSIKILGVAVAASLTAMAFIGAASASAWTDYLHNGSALTATDAPHDVDFDIVGDLTLADNGVGIVVTCDDADVALADGTVDVNGAGTIDNASAVDCVSSNPAACADPDADAVNLPWSTQLLANDRVDIASINGDSIGWAVTCASGLVDTCTADEDADAGNGEAAVTNVGSPPTAARATFDNQTPDGDCSIGGVGQGQARGSVDGLYPDGHTGGVQ